MPIQAILDNACVAAARWSARLPRIRGKNRAFFTVYRAMGLAGRHVHVDTTLRFPVAYRVRLDLHSWLQRLAFIDGGYEAGTVSFLLKLAERSPGYLLDVGANVGLITIPAALMLAGSGPRVFSVEAVPANARALRHNIALNHLQELVTVIDMALGEKEGAVEVNIEGDLLEGQGTGTASILAEGQTWCSAHSTIQVTTLDHLVRRGQLPGGCGVIKIDTDGYDLKVLQGGLHFLADNRPVVFGEFMTACMAAHGQTVEDVLRFAGDNGYVAWARGKGSLFSADFDRAAFVQDLLLVPREKLAAFDWCLRTA